MSTQTITDAKAAASQELLQILMSFSADEIAKLRHLLCQAEKLMRNGHEKSTEPQRPRRFIDPDDGGPAWEFEFVDEFDRASCYEDTRYEL